MSYFDLGDTTLVERVGYSGVDGVTDKIGSFVGAAGKGALSLYGATKTSEGAALAYKEQLAAKQSSMPSWLLPVSLGAVGLVAIFMITKKRK